MTITQKKRLTDDWAAVALGFLIIAGSMAGILLQFPGFNWGGAVSFGASILSAQNLEKLGLQFIYVWVIALTGAWLTGKPVKNAVKSFPVIYILTLIAFIIGGNSSVQLLNMESVIFCLAIGLLTGNLFKLPEWLKQSLNSEFFVKIGLVLLGTSVIFTDILKAGSLGLIQALAVVLSVWYFSYWLCKRLKVDDELAMMLSSAVSICGVSAAIATSGAIKGDPKKLSLVVSLVLITAVPMMIAMPWIARYLNFREEVTGAWLGGTIDTTGAVVASGTLVGETALRISTIVKFSQNVLLGIAAFIISLYWSYTKKTPGVAEAEKATLKVIWERFPKFVIGFIAASLLFSFLVHPEMSSEVKTPLKNLQGLWFALAFTSIGLETNFKDLVGIHNRKPVIAFLGAQLFNIFITLIIAYYLFR